MIEQDTIKLLRECDAGIKMGIASIDDVISHVQSKNFSQLLTKCRQEHEQRKQQRGKPFCQFHCFVPLSSVFLSPLRAKAIAL